MTGERAGISELKRVLLRREDYHPFPAYTDRAAWEAVPGKLRDAYLSQEAAAEVLGYVPPVLEASRFMALYRTGTADPVYGEISYGRRKMLCRAMLSECLEGKGRFLDKIIDLVWCICEESSWVGETHNNHMHNHMLSGVNKNALPDVLDFNMIDLHGGRTAGLLSWVYYFLKDALDEQSPLVCKRIELELTKRIFIPFMTHDDMTWMGFWGHKINNWNPWILSNIMLATLITAKDPDFRRECFGRCMEKLDIYTNQCPADGGCDEGPGYWYGAGAALYDCLAIILEASDGQLNFMGEPLIRNIGEYIAKANLSGLYHANFADNGAKARSDNLLLYRFAKHIGSEYLERFARSRFDPEYLPLPEPGMNLYRDLKSFFGYAQLCALPETTYTPRSAILPDTQLLFARTADNTVQLAAKGGFNNESHNHNDLGSFILARDGKPILVDLGALPYRDKTFSPQRYEIWILTAAWHNCAQINGFEQHDGDTYRAVLLDSGITDAQAWMELELCGAYEAEAGIRSYIRKLVLNRENGSLTVEDRLSLAEPGVVTRHFVTIHEPERTADGALLPAGDVRLRLTLDTPAAYSVVEQDLESDGLKEIWESETARRIDLTDRVESHAVLRAVFTWETR